MSGNSSSNNRPLGHTSRPRQRQSIGSSSNNNNPPNIEVSLRPTAATILRNRRRARNASTTRPTGQLQGATTTNSLTLRTNINELSSIISPTDSSEPSSILLLSRSPSSSEERNRDTTITNYRNIATTIALTLRDWTSPTSNHVQDYDNDNTDLNFDLASELTERSRTILVQDLQGHSRAKPARVSFYNGKDGETRNVLAKYSSSCNSMVKNEKHLKKIFQHLNWNELLVARLVCKKWQDVIFDNKFQANCGVITFRQNLEMLKDFNKSSVMWAQFRFKLNVSFDLSNQFQSEFWWRHGAFIRHLELCNTSLTLSVLVEILSRCQNLTSLVISWTGSMYSFNSELIEKYYGIRFHNGTFSKLASLTIDKSSHLTDTGLWSLLKWCGSSLESIGLREDLREDPLTRLKPRWTFEPIENFVNRFGFQGNVKSLDFTCSNINKNDLNRLADADRLNCLTKLRLSHCKKINDAAMLKFLLKKGQQLEEIYLDYTAVTEKLFDLTENRPIILKKLRTLDITGVQNIKNLYFVNTALKNLEELFCGKTTWITHDWHAMVLKVIGEHSVKIKKLDVHVAEKTHDRHIDSHFGQIWFRQFISMLPKISEINLSAWGDAVATNANFQLLCKNCHGLKRLSLAGWTGLTDEGISGLTFYQMLESQKSRNTSKPKYCPIIAQLSGLNFVDFGGCAQLTDLSIRLGFQFLPNLRALDLQRTLVTDAGIEALISKSTTLDKLCLAGCEGITSKLKKINRMDGRCVFIGHIS